MVESTERLKDTVEIEFPTDVDTLQRWYRNPMQCCVHLLKYTLQDMQYPGARNRAWSCDVDDVQILGVQVQYEVFKNALHPSVVTITFDALVVNVTKHEVEGYQPIMRQYARDGNRKVGKRLTSAR